jgi:hypothetical protein
MSGAEREAVLNDLIGFINTEVYLAGDEAEQEIVAYLQTRPEFIDVGIDEAGSAWGMFADGVIYSHMTRRFETELDGSSATAPSQPGRALPLLAPGASGGFGQLATAVAPSPLAGLHTSFQTAAFGASLPDSNAALLMKGLSDYYPDIPAEMRAGLHNSGYQVQTTEASVDALKLGGVPGHDPNLPKFPKLGVLYVNTHGGLAGLFTTTKQSAANDGKYARELAEGELGTGSAAVAANPNYIPHNPDCLVAKPDPTVCNKEIEEKHYVITGKFIARNWSGDKFADGSFAVLDACSSVAMAIPIGLNTNVAVVAGWDGSVSVGGANRILFLYLDRLLGLNQAEPDVTPDLRPFDAARVAEYMKKGHDTDGGARLIMAQAPASLVPSIKVLSVDESRDEMLIEGMFGEQPGQVYIDKQLIDGVDWQKGLIRVPVDDTMAGPVYVEQRGRKSNEVLLTEWRGEMNFVGDAGQLGKDLIIEASFDLHLRADIHMFREVPWEVPVLRTVTISAAGDSESKFRAFGTSSQTGMNITAFGEGEMKVEEEGMSHADALFNVKATLKIVTWDQPPQIDHTSLHAHLSSEPGTEARLKIETPIETLDSGFPLPLTDALDPLPFEFDQSYNITEGSTSGTVFGGSSAALSWTEQRSNHAPDPTKPPQAALGRVHAV